MRVYPSFSTTERLLCSLFVDYPFVRELLKKKKKRKKGRKEKEKNKRETKKNGSSKMETTFGKGKWRVRKFQLV